jgi:hypothetical protein
VTGFPELISAKTADIPDLGCDDVAEELKRDAEGGQGAEGALFATLPGGCHTGPNG